MSAARERTRSACRRLLLTAMLACAALAAPAPAAGQSVQVVEPGGTAIALEVHKGSLVRLPGPAQTVFVADPDIADIQIKSPRLVYVFGKRAGETSLFAVDAGEAVLANARITVTPNLGRLRSAIDQLTGPGVELEAVAGSILLTGTVGSASIAEDVRRLAAQFASGEDGVINRIRVDGPNQVNLRVRVAEVSRRVIKQFGFNWEALFSSGGFLLGLATGNPVVAAGGGFLIRNAAGPRTSNSAVAAYRSGTLDLNVLVDALADEGLLSVLAEPNLTAMSGEPASFLAGGEFPIPVPQDANTVTVEFKRFGVSLAFTPTILEGGRINLRVNPEVSELTSTGSIQINNFVIPALTTRRAETTVELGSGQSFAIAGLLKNDLDHDISKFPGLGDLPVLGTLFRSDTFQRGETELVIIVTPYIVKPVTMARLQAPTDGLVPATDADRILLGRHQGRPPAGATAPGTAPRLTGPVGFILE